MNERSERVRLHLRLNTYRHVLGYDAVPWGEVERIELSALARDVELLRGEADLAIEAGRERPWLQGPDWDE